MKISAKTSTNCLLIILILYLLFFFFVLKRSLLSQKDCEIFKIPEYEKYELKLDQKDYFNDVVITTAQNFDLGTDTLALMHIQKTSGTGWENHILKHLLVKRQDSWEPACIYNKRQNRNTCILNNYKKSIYWDRYLSRFCDIHADYSELKNCIMKEYNNRISLPVSSSSYFGISHFMTFLRDPIQRYISEYEHVKKGATWLKAVRSCKDIALYKEKCYKNESWKGVSWQEFVNCKYNLANNRQVRMLADYNIIGCNVLKCWASNCTPELKHFYEQKLLHSAKHALIGFAFFGLTEYQKLSEFLFLKTFDDNKFTFSEEINDYKDTIASSSIKGEATSYMENIKKNNHLDIELYKFAKELFFKRVAYYQTEANT